MDFYKINERKTKLRGEEHERKEIYPDFKITRSKDLMVQGKSFYAIWDSEAGLWSQDEYDVQRLIDSNLTRHRDELNSKLLPGEQLYHAKLLSNFSSNSWMQFRSYISHISDSSHPLDENLTFSNTKVKKADHVSKRLPYPLEAGGYDAWDELIGTLYEPPERAKLEWAIGAIVAGDAKDIQKFLVLYGAAGAGKSTILNIIQKLFVGYYTTFEAKALTANSNAFATEVFKGNPLVAIQHDGDLSKIEDNTKLNSIVSHEEMTMNEKYKPSYTSRINAFLFMGTNKAVMITDAKSGIIRRLIDVNPSGNKLSPRRYQTVMSQIDFELGAIAHHCLEVYRKMGKNYYDGYRPVEMMLQTDVFYNYIESAYDVFREQDGVTLTQAYELYKLYCEDSNIQYKLAKYKFREELRNYFRDFEDRAVIEGVPVRSWYSGFETETFKPPKVEEAIFSLVLDQDKSLLDDDLADRPAQYSKEDGTPRKFWSNDPRMDNQTGKEYTPKPSQVVSTVLSDIDTSKEHYVKPPLNHIVIDFDFTDDSGVKSPERNLEAASKWPITYAEFSKSGGGIHLHYNWAGDVHELSRVYSDGIEIKVFTGHSSLRRRVSKSNSIPVATLSSGLPLKEKKMISAEVVKSERSIRDLIERNLRKEIHPGTKPSIDFIAKILSDANREGLPYDVSDMKGKVLAFANNSSNQALYCIKAVMQMKFVSDAMENSEVKEAGPDKNSTLVFFDCEVFPNLFIVNWKYDDGTKDVVRMINPTPQEIENLVKMKLVGFNCRRYDNHILYGRIMGYNNEQIYRLSKKIIDNVPNAHFGEAYDLSYADIYDYSSKKQSLKKFQVELGLTHIENAIPWDEPVPEERWVEVAEYCDNDVLSTEAVHKAREQDFVARKLLADLSGLPVNATTQKHTAKIIFGGNKDAQKQFEYTNLSDMFEGYTYIGGKSEYRGEDPSEGGYVHAEHGMYKNVAVLDIASMHPTSIIELNAFGPYTKKFEELMKARLAIKHGDYETAKTMLDGKLTPYLKDPKDAEALSYALKIVINIVYGLTSAKFDNPFRDIRNKDNIVAKRGALFMIDLKHFVEKQGFIAAHIKTDSIKIPDATPEIIEAVMEFGAKYGYTFEHEATYDKFALVNDAVYIAKVRAGRKPAYWDAVGAQFQHPYVFKKLFAKEPIEFDDLCETKSVASAIYIDFRDEEDDTPMFLDDSDMRFIGKVGRFCPIKPGAGGGKLLRVKDDKTYAVTGTKGYEWLEADMVKNMGKEKDIDMSYFDKLVDNAVTNISKYGDFEWLAD